MTPTLVLNDEPATNHISGCRPNERIAIHADLMEGANFRWVSQSEFVTDAEGMIDSGKQASTAGSHTEISAIGPVWSMKPSVSKEGRY